MADIKKTEDEVAIRVANVSKTFKIPHEKHTSLKSAAINIFQKNTYEEFDALKEISFEVKKGEFFGIIGRNGSGKSTLLKILAGIYVPNKDGRITIAGKLSPFLELGVGFNPELTGRENVFLGGTILGLSRKEVAEKFDKIVKFAELEEFIDMKFSNYSSGMQVRLAFALAINARAEILLMDEVLAVGDSNFQAKCIEEFNRYKEQGKTVVLVTHDIGTVQRYCNRAMLLRNGKIVKIGSADEVGNEYMDQNILDEESRIQGEEHLEERDTTLQKKQTKKKAKITGVEFLDSTGAKRNVFETGEDLTVRVYFKQLKKNQKLNFGVAIMNQEGNYVSGINTIIDQIDTTKYLRDGFFEVDYKNIKLLRNSYYITAAIGNENFLIPIDRVTKSQYFKVSSRTKNEGIVEMEYKWR
jgi:ABC-type polysaccharide/polyol phosphate transport system ATPase subunit